jgi:hypothetical protein
MSSSVLDADPRHPQPAEFHLGLACLMVALGGLLLGLQVDGTGALVGTGYGSLGIGAVVALSATLFQAVRAHSLPRDLIGGFSAVCGFLGITFVVAGVLAPGGGWMFFEMLLLVALLARRHASARPAGPDLRGSTVAVLTLMLLFRLWITWQGSEHRWQVMSLPIPVLSSIPLEVLAPIQRVSLGAFTPGDLGFPPAGLSFSSTLALWAGGFALCAAGLLWRSHAAVEHENDRIHATIHELPPALASLVDTLLPEEDWPAMGLHGLSDRMRRKRIEALVGERLRRRRELETAFGSLDLLELTNPGGFTGEVVRTLLLEAPDQARKDPEP